MLDGSEVKKEVVEKIRNRSVILAVGSEADGLSDKIVSAAELKVKIAHSKNVESLNAAVASSILMSSLYDL